MNHSTSLRTGYAIRLTTVDFVQGKSCTHVLKKRYRAQQLAQKTADALCYVCKPDGKTKTSEVFAIVIPASSVS